MFYVYLSWEMFPGAPPTDMLYLYIVAYELYLIAALAYALVRMLRGHSTTIPIAVLPYPGKRHPYRKILITLEPRKQ